MWVIRVHMECEVEYAAFIDAYDSSQLLDNVCWSVAEITFVWGDGEGEIQYISWVGEVCFHRIG